MSSLNSQENDDEETRHGGRETSGSKRQSGERKDREGEGGHFLNESAIGAA
jgi:hypothetical protein